MGGDVHVSIAREVGDDVFRKSVGQPPRRFVAGNVHERQDGERRPAGEARHSAMRPKAPGGQANRQKQRCRQRPQGATINLARTRSRRRTSRPVQSNSVRAHRTSDIFQLLIAEKLEWNVEFALQWVVGSAGYENAPGLGELFETGRDVDPVAIEVGPVDYHIAEVDADPEVKRLVSLM